MPITCLATHHNCVGAFFKYCDRFTLYCNHCMPTSQAWPVLLVLQLLILPLLQSPVFMLFDQLVYVPRPLDAIATLTHNGLLAFQYCFPAPIAIPDHLSKQRPNVYLYTSHRR